MCFDATETLYRFYAVTQTQQERKPIFCRKLRTGVSCYKLLKTGFPILLFMFLICRPHIVSHYSTRGNFMKVV